MLHFPPPVWALAYVLIAAAMSYQAGWPRVSGLPIVPLAVVLVAIGAALSITAAMLFRRERTELNPTSTTNRTLVTTGPFRFTRNPMYLALVLVTFGIALWVGAWPMFLAPRHVNLDAARGERREGGPGLPRRAKRAAAPSFPIATDRR
jgi:protein-S-isoprenylcysteine O-methyltransferase Ste14